MISAPCLHPARFILGSCGFVITVMLGCHFLATEAYADGKVVGPREYRGRPYSGSLEERAQEAIIIFQALKTKGEAMEDLILKIQVEGKIDHFAWIVPFPTPPETAKEDAALFQELHQYVEARLAPRRQPAGTKFKDRRVETKSSPEKPVEVLSRKVVGTYDVAVVREKVAGKLNQWLKEEGYQTLPDADDVIAHYRKKGYVFACIKVANTRLSQLETVDLHPLRFTFKTGGRDGIYFPMKMTGLQKQPFDVNLYVFFRFWINDRLSKFGFEHRGFRLRYRDWDSDDCEPDAGKWYSRPELDPFLKNLAHTIPAVTKLFQKLHPGENYYLTNIQAYDLRPEDVRLWSDDLWLFPYYTGSSRVPYDVQNNGPASAAWPNEKESLEEDEEGPDLWLWVAAGGSGLAALLIGLFAFRRRRSTEQG
jgi:hypothetical protein